MASFSIDTFTSKLKGGGALASLFKAELTASKGPVLKSQAQNDFEFLCKATTFPSDTIDVATVTYMGRGINIPGNRAATQWTTTVYNDEGMEVRNNIESWMEKLNSHKTNIRASDFTEISSYTGELKVSQLDKSAGVVTKEYVFVDAWPSGIGEITIDWETNEIQTYDVTWEFSYWTSTHSGVGGGRVTGAGSGRSDYRLKDNILLLREGTSTIPNLYMFKYKWDKFTNYIGVMAQELLDTGFKNAVHKDSNGYYSVDYRKLGFPMLRISNPSI